jgi:hypothetical protein
MGGECAFVGSALRTVSGVTTCRGWSARWTLQASGDRFGALMIAGERQNVLPSRGNDSLSAFERGITRRRSSASHDRLGSFAARPP